MDTNQAQASTQKNSSLIKIVGMIVAFIILISISVFMYTSARKISEPAAIIEVSKQLNYTKAEFKETVPTSFLSTIPLPKDVTFNQSYELSYASDSSKQASVVFSSDKNVIENYNIYKAFLEKGGWWVPDYYKHVSKDLSSLYGNLYDAEKGLIYTININIQKVAASKASTTTPAMASEVSISLLTKKK